MVFEVKPLFTWLTPSYYLSLSDNIENPPAAHSPRVYNEVVEMIHSLVSSPCRGVLPHGRSRHFSSSDLFGQVTDIVFLKMVSS